MKNTTHATHLPLIALLCVVIWLFPDTTAHANDAKRNEQERLRSLSIYKTLDQMDTAEGETATQSFILETIAQLMDEKYNPDSGDKLRAVFIWLHDWADRGKSPAYGFLYAEHLYAILLNDNNNLPTLQAEDISQQALQSYFLSFQLMRENMARCGGESRTYSGNAIFIPIFKRFIPYKKFFDTMKAHQKRAIVRYVLEKSDDLKDRPPNFNLCKKSTDDTSPALIADEDWLKLRDKYRAEFRKKLFPAEE